MMKNTSFRLLHAVVTVACLLAVPAWGQGGILDEETAQNADIGALRDEVSLFDSISKGIALSLAVCEGDAGCIPNVNRSELDRIITTLNTRIGSLSLRYDTTGDEDLAGILISYADTRDTYTAYLDDLAGYESGQDEVMDAVEDELGDDAFDIFRDADEEL